MTATGDGRTDDRLSISHRTRHGYPAHYVQLDGDRYHLVHAEEYEGRWFLVKLDEWGEREWATALVDRGGSFHGLSLAGDVGDEDPVEDVRRLPEPFHAVLAAAGYCLVPRGEWWL
jgi:hypothetical protein